MLDFNYSALIVTNQWTGSLNLLRVARALHVPRKWLKNQKNRDPVRVSFAVFVSVGGISSRSRSRELETMVNDLGLGFSFSISVFWIDSWFLSSFFFLIFSSDHLQEESTWDLQVPLPRYGIPYRIWPNFCLIFFATIYLYFFIYVWFSNFWNLIS